MSLQFLASLAIEPLYHWLFLILVLLVFTVFHLHGVIRLAAFLFLYMAVVLLSPISGWMLRSLESSHPAELVGIKPAVVVLSGGIVKYDRFRQQYLWGASGDRYLEAVRSLNIGGNSDSSSDSSSDGTIFIFSGVSPERLSPESVRGQTKQNSSSSEGAESSDSGANLLSEAASMKSYALETGLLEQQIIAEEQSTSTWENAQFVGRILREKGIRDFYLVTSAYHMTRSMMVFKYFGMQPTPFAVDFSSDSGLRQKAFANLAMYRMAIHEFVGIVYYKAKMIFASGDEAVDKEEQ